MYFFAIVPDDSHCGLYLLEKIEDATLPRLWSIYNDGFEVGIKEFVQTHLGDHLWIGQYNGDPNDLRLYNWTIERNRCLDITSLLEKSIVIQASNTEVNRLRDYVAYTRQFSEILKKRHSSEVGAAPYYHGEGYYHDGVLLTDPKKEIQGRRPTDIRGRQDIYTIDMNEPVPERSCDIHHITQFFAEEAEGQIPLARTNCVTFVTTVLDKYCGLDLENLFPTLTERTNAIIVRGGFLDFHSKTLGAHENESKATKMNGRIVISARNLNNLNDIPRLVDTLDSNKITRIPALR